MAFGSIGLFPDTAPASKAIAAALKTSLTAKGVECDVIDAPEAGVDYSYTWRLYFTLPAGSLGFTIQAAVKSPIVAIIEFLLTKFEIQKGSGYIPAGAQGVRSNDVRIQLGGAANASILIAQASNFAETFAALYKMTTFPTLSGLQIAMNDDPWFLSSVWGEDVETKEAGDSGAIDFSLYNSLLVKALSLSAGSDKAEPYEWAAPIHTNAVGTGNFACAFTARTSPSAAGNAKLRLTVSGVSQDFTLTPSWAMYSFVGSLSGDEECRVGILENAAEITGVFIYKEIASISLMSQIAQYTPLPQDYFDLFALLGDNSASSTASAASASPIPQATATSAFQNLDSFSGMLQGMLGNVASDIPSLFSVLDPNKFINLKTDALKKTLPDMNNIALRLKTQQMIHYIDNVVRTAKKYTEGPIIKDLDPEAIKKKEQEVSGMVSDRIKEFSSMLDAGGMKAKAEAALSQAKAVQGQIQAAQQKVEQLTTSANKIVTSTVPNVFHDASITSAVTAATKTITTTASTATSAVKAASSTLTNFYDSSLKK